MGLVLQDTRCQGSGIIRGILVARQFKFLEPFDSASSVCILILELLVQEEWSIRVEWVHPSSCKRASHPYPGP
jgi:hypothetical protein